MITKNTNRDPSPPWPALVLLFVMLILSVVMMQRFAQKRAELGPCTNTEGVLVTSKWTEGEEYFLYTEYLRTNARKYQVSKEIFNQAETGKHYTFYEDICGNHPGAYFPNPFKIELMEK